jgi:hypothetical protein
MIQQAILLAVLGSTLFVAACHPPTGNSSDLAAMSVPSQVPNS